MNKVIILGRLIKDIDLKYSQSGTAFANMTVAVDRGMSKDKKAEAQAKGQPTSDFIPCKLFGKTAEIVAQYFQKGDQIVVEGRIQTGSYEKDGHKVYTTDVAVDRFEFVGKSEKKEPQQSNSYENNNDFMAMDDSDESIPF